MSDDEEDEWVTEVRQSVAGSVVIHNCFLLTLLTIEMRLLLLNDVNTQAAEQLFRDVNKHSNCQAMSESHFYMFWLYIFDLHNLRLMVISTLDVGFTFHSQNVDNVILKLLFTASVGWIG